MVHVRAFALAPLVRRGQPMPPVGSRALNAGQVCIEFPRGDVIACQRLLELFLFAAVARGDDIELRIVPAHGASRGEETT